MSLRPAVAAAVIVLVALTATACGSERGGLGAEGAPRASSAVPRPSYAPLPLCAQAPGVPTGGPSVSPDPSTYENADRPPNYADNHAYRMSAPLSEARRASGEASAALIRRELEKARAEGDFSDARITAALGRLGCGPENGMYVGSGFYAVHTGVTCVTGRVSEEGLTSEVLGAYAEPQPGMGPCVENRGGH